MQATFNIDGTSARDATSQDTLERRHQCEMKLTTEAQHECNTNISADSIALNGRPVSVGLRRQPTIYPHGLGISVQTMRTINTDSSYDESCKSFNNYSRASTLRSENWHGQHHQISNSEQNSLSSEQNSHRKYRISMIGNPEGLAELQVRRYKYPLTGNYYLDPQDQITKASWAYKYYECAKRYCRWKYVRWPIFFMASVLLFFGLITYCIWLHDISIARQRYLQQRRFQYSFETADEFKESNEELNTTIETPFDLAVRTTTPATTITTERRHRLQESTLLRAIGTGTLSRQRPKEQKLTTNDFDTSKGAVEWEKQKINLSKKTTLPADEDYMETEYSDELQGEDDYEVKPMQQIRFTSGHQNGFGVPIEEDERLVSIINGLGQNSPASTALTPRTKVSPTIPPVKPTSAMDASALPAQENGCYSTSLPMCQGVLEYDLTYNATTQLSPLERTVFENLIYTNCSARAVEFICALLEPECRPKHIGILPPCRRICKAIFEACSIEISNSDILSNAFDCSLYPDSTDPQRCEDPTRRSNFCYDNEFECYDNTCIPYQWQCDNIKDCASGEDEDECLQCDHQNEFRCRSNDKCIPESVRCDSKYDCFDGSDEDDCEEYGSGDESAAGFDEAAVNSFPRVFSYASYLSPNQSNEEGLFRYITAKTVDEAGAKYEVHEMTNRTSGVSKEEVTNNVPEIGPKGFVNFRDSKEIMMTSDSENKFKYSSVRGNRNSSRFSTPATFRTSTTIATTLQPAASRAVIRTTSRPVEKATVTCAPHQLRCISGKCITVAQLCDKKIDCPDGADELMCVYKQERSTTKRYNAMQSTKADIIVTTESTRSDRRTVRTTTLKRRLKV